MVALTVKLLDQSPVHSSRVALLGDAAPGDIDEAISAVKFAIGDEAETVADPWDASSGVNRTYIDAGELLTEAFQRRSLLRGIRAASTINLIAQDADLSSQVDCEGGGDCGPAITGGVDINGVTKNFYLQDTRDWYAVHGGGRTSSCNILMADGSVRDFFDTNNDKFLNPGFQVPEDLTDEQYALIGYRGGDVELPPQEMFNGIFLQSFQKRSVFESN